MCVFKLEKTTVIPNFFLKICNSRTTLVLRYRERQTSLTAQYYFHWGKDMELLVIPALSVTLVVAFMIDFVFELPFQRTYRQTHMGI
jgi:hypothetical protein